MRVRFWGTRGSIPKPGPAYVRYGGNTSCVEVRTASGVLILLDCGTGAHPLGQALLAEPGAPRHGHVFISHTHWDHIQGLPFLAPLFVSDFEWDIYGPRGLGPSIRETLAGQMQYTYFPIEIEQFAAKVRYHDLVEGSFQIDDVHISAHFMNHPALTLGYRIEADGASVVYATDHESNPFGIQWMLYEEGCNLPEIVRTVPHVAFEVDDLRDALKGKKVIIEPNSPSPGVTVAFIEEAGAPIEFLEFGDKRPPK